MKFIVTVVLMFLLLTACSPELIQSVSPPQNTPTSALKITQTPPPSQTPTIPTSTETPIPQSPAEATIKAFGTICKPPARDWDSEVSPNGLWIAMACRGNDAEVDSHLRVVSIQGDKNWSIHYRDYSKGTNYDRNNMIYLFHWSADGKYLYATSPSKVSGCCWIGWDVLLVRLNLENGQQTEIANYINVISGGISFSVSTSDRYVLSTPRGSLLILDLSTWNQRKIEIELEMGSAGYPLMSPDDKKVILMLREYPKELQGDLTFGSLVVIDLESGSQKKLLSGMEYEDTPVPVSWRDNDNVL